MFDSIRKISVLTLILSLACLVSLNAQEKKLIQLSDIWASGIFYPSIQDKVVHMNDGEHYAILEDNIFINKYEYKTGKNSEIIVRSSQLVPTGGAKPISIDEFVFSNDESKILLSTKTERIYRYSTRAEYYIWDVKKQTLTQVSDKGKQRLAQFSPDGKQVAFVRDNDVYISNLNTKNEIRVTTDGMKNQIINGATDWVYEEELDLANGLYWSPDGRKIAFYRFDESRVKEFSMIKFGELYPEVVTFKYPKAGEDNSVVSILVYDLENGKTTIINTGTETDQYIPRVRWAPGKDKLVIYRLNRLQNKLEFLMADANTGESSVFYTEDNKHYIDINDNIFFTADGLSFIYTSEKNGYNHIFINDLKGHEKQITMGEWEVSEIKAFDTKTSTIYYVSNEPFIYNKDLYSIKSDGSGKKRLTQGDGKNDPDISKTFKYFINNFSSLNNPPLATIYDIQGKLIKTIEENESVRKAMQEYDFARAEYFSFKTSYDVELCGWMMKPTDFIATKKYPVLMYVYGGPGMQTATNDWGYFDYVWFQMLAQKGYIVVTVDNRGTALKGQDFKKSTYGELGKMETEDQIEVAKYLGKMDYIDNKRIGMFGWSFGGYLTLLCLTKGADYFKTGIAVAPVTNWRYYDNIYTERYMGKPQDNASGYDNNSPVNFVKKLKGKLLICHGTADDNVHLQNTMEIADALVKANKQFEMQLYTNKNHGIYGGYSRLHLYTRMTDFILENL